MIYLPIILIWLYFLQLYHSSVLFYFELNRYIFSSAILETFYLNDSLFIASTKDSHVFLLNITDPEEPPTLINSLETRIPLTTFTVSSENFLIGLGNNITSNIQALEIYKISANYQNEISHISTLEFAEITNNLHNILCLDDKCDLLSFVDENLGIRLLNLTAKALPEEIPQTDLFKNYVTYQTLVKSGEILATFNDKTVVALNISEPKNVKIIAEVPSSYVTTISSYKKNVIFMSCLSTWDGRIFQWQFSQENDSSEPFATWPLVYKDGSSTIYQSPQPNTCALGSPSTIRFTDEFLLITTPRYQFYSLIDWSYYVFWGYTTDDLFLVRHRNDLYNIFVYKKDQYIKVNQRLNISSLVVPHTLVQSTVYQISDPSYFAPQAILIIGDENARFLITASAQPGFYTMGSFTEIKPLAFFLEAMYSSNNLWGDLKKRYIMVFGTSYDYNTNEFGGYTMFFYDYSLKSNTAVAQIPIYKTLWPQFVVNPVQFDDLLYLFPITWNQAKMMREFLLVVNISNIKQLNLEETNVEGGTGEFRSAIGSCERNGEKFIFIAREREPHIYFYRISTENYKELEEVGKIFITTRFSTIVASEDCNYLFAGGDAFYMINIGSFSEPHVVSALNLGGSGNLKVFSDRVYVITMKIVYIFDISKGFPVLMSSAKHPVRNEKTKANLFRIDYLENGNSNYIYKGSSNQDDKKGIEITIYEEKKLFFIFVKMDNELIVGVPRSFRYFCLDLEDYNEPKGVISSVHLTNTTANFPTLTAIPSWVFFDFNTQEVTITVPKNYQYENLSLVFEMKNAFLENPEFYQQVITFSLAKSSLSYQIDPFLKIITPSTNNVQVSIKHFPDIQFVFLNFAGIFTTYSEKTGVLVASGLLEAINDMLKKLRVTKISLEIYPKKFNISVQDSLNNDIIDEVIDYTEETLHFNQAPQLLLSNFQELIDNQSTYAVPLQRFVYEIKSTIFADPESDPMSFQIFSIDSEVLPSWLSFDPVRLRISGTPTEKDLGLLNISLRVSDGFDYFEEKFHLNISDNPPNLVIPIQSQLFNNIASVGQEFSFVLKPATFQDSDGPYSLQYTIYFHDMNNLNKQLMVPTTNYWLKFDYSTLSFLGTPSFEDAYEFGNNLTIIVVASDGVKNSSDKFVISVFPSMKKTANFNNNDSNNSTFPLIEYLDNQKLTMEISVEYGSIIVLNEFLANYSSNIEFSISKDLKEMKLIATADILNKVFSYLVYRNISNDNLRILQETQTINVVYNVYDSLGQNLSGEILSNSIKTSNILPEIDKNFISNYYLAEIGSNFRVLISKKLINFAEIPQMKLNYSFNLISDEGIKQSWIYMQENNENIEIFSGVNVDSSLLGNYYAILTISDEFSSNYKQEFLIRVDYSTLEKVKNYLQLISTIVGPLISLLAITKLFYLIYNRMWKNYIEKKDVYLQVNTRFKLKVPLIEHEFNLANKLFCNIKNVAIQENKKYFQLFLTKEMMNKMGSITQLNQFDDYINQFLNGDCKKKDNVKVLTEGLFIKYLIEHFPNASLFLKEFEQQTVISHKSDIDEWFNQFFFNENLKNVQDLSDIFGEDCLVKLQIENYVLQLGTYKSVEKNLYILGNYYDYVFQKTVLQMKKIKFTNEQLRILKPLILRAIIAVKRGIPFNHSPAAFYFNNMLSALGMRILPYNFGDAIHLPDNSVKYIKTFEEKNDQEEVKSKEGCCNRFKKCLGSIFPYRQYYSINDKSFPNWLSVDLKKGYLVFHGIPYKDEYKKKYIVRICTRHKFNVIQLTFNISDINQLKAQAKTFSRRIATDPKIRDSMNKISLRDFYDASKRQTSSHKKSLRSEEFSEFLEEKKLEVTIHK